MRGILKINIFITVLFGAAYLLSKTGMPYLCYIIGPLFFVLPGFNIAWIIEQITGNHQGAFKLSSYALLFSFTVMPFAIYVLAFIFNNFANEAITLSSWGGIWLISFLLLTALAKKLRCPITRFSFSLLFKDRILITSAAIFLLVYVIASFSYRFIPEQDAYLYLIKISDLLKDPHSLSDMRPIYLALLWSFNIITGLPYYFISKYILSALGFTFVLVLNKISSKYIQDRSVRVVANLSFLSFPVITSELFYGRPQNVLIMLFPVILYLLGTLVEERDNRKNIYWLIAIATSIGAGLKIHELFFSLGIILIFSFYLFFKEKIIHKLSTSILIALFGLSYVYLALNLVGISDYFSVVLKPFANAVIHPKFHLWFLGGYFDYFNTYVSIKGLSVIYYYGYNIGFLAVLVLFIYLKNRKIVNFNSPIFTLSLVGFLVFLLIAEFFPRLGFAFLPDRAWIYIGIAASFFFVPILGSIKGKLLGLSVSLLFAGTIFLCLIFIYQRQGWTTQDEYAAAKYLRGNLPRNSIIISQPSNLPMLEYFAGYKLQIPDDQFFESGGKYANDYIDELETFYADHEKKKDESNKILSEISNNFELIKQNQCFEYNQCRKDLINYRKNIMRYTTLKNQISKDGKELADAEDNIYVVFSEQKITGYYGKYSEWLKINFAKANVNNFGEPYFEKIYENKGIHAWKYKPVQ